MYAALMQAGVPASFIPIRGAGHGFEGADAERAFAALIHTKLSGSSRDVHDTFALSPARDTSGSPFQRIGASRLNPSRDASQPPSSALASGHSIGVQRSNRRSLDSQVDGR